MLLRSRRESTISRVVWQFMSFFLVGDVALAIDIFLSFSCALHSATFGVFVAFNFRETKDLAA